MTPMENWSANALPRLLVEGVWLEGMELHAKLLARLKDMKKVFAMKNKPAHVVVAIANGETPLTKLKTLAKVLEIQLLISLDKLRHYLPYVFFEKKSCYIL